MSIPLTPALLPRPLKRPLDRALATAVNGLEVARFGGLRIEDEASPYEVVAHEPIYRLRRYFPDAPAGSRAPVLLVPPLMMTAEVWDVVRQSSAVSILHAQGLDPWVVDFGDPGREPGGTERNVTDHVLAVVDAVERVRGVTGQDLHIGGYSQGGLFCYQAAAYRRCDGIASIFSLGAAVQGPFLIGEGYLPEELAAEVTRLESKILARTGLPGWAVGRTFKLLDPVNAVRQDLTFLRALHDREALLPRERQRRFLARDGWVGWSGPAIGELADSLEHERYLKGGLVLGDRTVSLADVTCPVLLFIGEADGVGPAPVVRAVVGAAPRAEVYECVLPVGHFGLPVGRQAAKRTWPGVAAWVRWRAGEGPLPDGVRPVNSDATREGADAPTGRPRGAALTYGLGVAAATAVANTEAIARTGRRMLDTTLEVSREAHAQLPRLVRLESMGPATRISWAKLLDDAARRRPEHMAFLFDDRAYTYAAGKQRVDRVVRELISLGVRRGEHVGVLMDTRPSALTAVAALNRLGAVAVMLRPGESTAREARLGRISRVLTDPEHASTAADLDLDVFVLGASGAPRELPPGAVDMERMDADAVKLPKWFRANPGRARDLAFIVFTGAGEQTRVDRITNGRWAQSALGAATAASLTPSDTIYSVSPLHHPSGLLLATGGSAAGGARLAMATRFDPDTFWSEVRRYGATVVPYTWTMLHELVDADPGPQERHHPIRLFVGSGMPRNLWRRVLDRFAPATVLELYASTRSGAILGNVSGRKVGALGRPLPGTPPVRIATWDGDRLATGEDGYGVQADTGMLLVEAPDGPLRDVFARDDAWIATGDLVRRDEDGDLWLANPSRLVEDALGDLVAVDLVACGDTFAAVTLRPGHTLTAATVNRTLAAIPADARPDIVRVLETMPLTSWFRPSVAGLHSDEHEPAGGQAWRRHPRTGRYHTIKTTRKEFR